VYTTPEYVQLLRHAGLEATAFFGAADGSELTWDTWRQLIVARKT
jgi:hypothetical protein